MSVSKLNGVFLGLSITSTWGNGHATTYRALLKEFAALGHTLTFLERDVPWYRNEREFESLPYCQIGLYSSLAELQERFAETIRQADFVVVGSYVPDGIQVGQWVLNTARGLRAFYDIDTPVTLANLSAQRCEYLSRALVSQYDLYLSFTGGPTLSYLQDVLRSPAARALYCSVDPALYFPEPAEPKWEMAYLGTYAEDRQPALERLLLDVASERNDRLFAVAGPQYPDDVMWPENVERIPHLPATRHREFYNAQAFTLNLTRRDMIRAGYSPSVRLFEAAACGIPIISDEWPGLNTIFQPGSEIVTVRTTTDVQTALKLPEKERRQMADRARRRVLECHTARVRAEELQAHIVAACDRKAHPISRRKVVVNESETAAAF